MPEAQVIDKPPVVDTPPAEDLKAKQLDAASKMFPDKELPNADTVDLNGKQPIVKSYKFGEVEISDEAEINTILKLHGREKPEEIEELSTDWNNRLSWKNDMEEKGRKFNSEKAGFENERKQFQAEREELANRQTQMKSDLMKEIEINKDYDGQRAEIQKKIDERKKELDIDDVDAMDAFNDFKFQEGIKIATLEMERKSALTKHTAYMEKLETDAKEQANALQHKNMVDLAVTYPEYDVEDIYKQGYEFNKLTDEQRADPKAIDNYPAFQKYRELLDYARANSQVSLARAQELRTLREMVKTYNVESKGVDTKLQEAEKSGYNKAVAEIKAKGISFFETKEGDKTIQVLDVNTDTAEIKRKQRAVASKMFAKTE